MTKCSAYIVVVSVLMVLASLVAAKEAFLGRVKVSGTGGLLEITNTQDRVGIASTFLSGAFSAGNTSTISTVTFAGSVTNVLASRASENTVVWADEGGTVQLDQGEILRFEWTETATPATGILSPFAR